MWGPRPRSLGPSQGGGGPPFSFLRTTFCDYSDKSGPRPRPPGPTFSFWPRPWVTFSHVSAIHSPILVPNVVGSPSAVIFFPRFRIIFSHFCVKCGVPVPGPWVRVNGGVPLVRFLRTTFCDSSVKYGAPSPAPGSGSRGGRRSIFRFLRTMFCDSSDKSGPRPRSPGPHFSFWPRP